jgi:ribosomal-protein-alanine N-acetyltransferase
VLMNGLKVDPMESAHIAEILEIEKILFPTPWTRTMFEEEVAGRPGPDGPGSYAVVATIDGRVIGYAVAWFIENGVHLMNIAVHREFHRRRIGKRLMNHLIETATAAGQRVILLEVRASNAAARAFYRQFGFRSVGIRPGYYSDNREDAVLMAVDLGVQKERRKREPRKREAT